jgi:hypothetical protein
LNSRTHATLSKRARITFKIQRQPATVNGKSGAPFGPRRKKKPGKYTIMRFEAREQAIVVDAARIYPAKEADVSCSK